MRLVASPFLFEGPRERVFAQALPMRHNPRGVCAPARSASAGHRSRAEENR